ncbi:MAG: metallophosphoesterase family protein [Nitrososphaeraceae archaeon]
MKFVQISDLHIGSLFKQDSFNTLVKEINELNPEAIIISGDLTDEGLIFQFKKVSDEIKKFTCPNVIVFPGNHDYRHTGYLVFKKFFPSSSNKVYEFKQGKDTPVVIITLDTALPDRDEGEIGDSQNLWINEILKTYDNNTIKIVAMHHHLISIPDTGFTNLVGILDSGDALRTLTENNVSLVLCGHKHRPWLWNLGNLKIVYAGTSCSWRYRGVFEDTYNIIDINENNIDIDIKIVGGKKFPMSDLVKKYQPEKRLVFSK